MQPVDIVIFFASIVVIGVGVTGFFGLFLPMPFVPTPKPIADRMVALAQFHGNECVYDLGAGDGAILIAAKERYPDLRATGVELSPLVWVLGKIRVLWAGKNIRFLWQNALRVDLREVDVIFLYALPRFLLTIQPKFDSELRPGTRVISHSFPFPNKASVETVQVPWGKGHRTLYRYEW